MFWWIGLILNLMFWWVGLILNLMFWWTGLILNLMFWWIGLILNLMFWCTRCTLVLKNKTPNCLSISPYFCYFPNNLECRMNVLTNYQTTLRSRLQRTNTEVYRKQWSLSIPEFSSIKHEEWGCCDDLCI